MHLKLTLVIGFGLTALGKRAEARLLPRSAVTSDGPGCFAAVANAGGIHRPFAVGGLKPRELPQFKWGDRATGRPGARPLEDDPGRCVPFAQVKYARYAEHGLAALACRLNRRFGLRTCGACLVVDVARCGPTREKVVRALAEARRAPEAT